MKFLRWHILSRGVLAELERNKSDVYWDGHSAGWAEREGFGSTMKLLDEGQTVAYLGRGHNFVLQPDGSCTWYWHKPEESTPIVLDRKGAE